MCSFHTYERINENNDNLHLLILPLRIPCCCPSLSVSKGQVQVQAASPLWGLSLFFNPGVLSPSLNSRGLIHSYCHVFNRHLSSEHLLWLVAIGEQDLCGPCLHKTYCLEEKAKWTFITLSILYWAYLFVSMSYFPCLFLEQHVWLICIFYTLLPAKQGKWAEDGIVAIEKLQMMKMLMTVS